IGALAEIGDAEYESMAPAQWPMPLAGSRERDGKRLFGAGRGFPTPDGHARFVPTPFRPPAELPDDEHWPLSLNTGRVRDQWHTMTRTGHVPRLMAHMREPLLDINPQDAARIGLAEGGLARVESR